MWGPAASGAAVHLPAGSGASDQHRVLRDGDTIRVGRTELTALATPGHRPEHTSLVVSELARAPRPAAVLTGDSLLVGDVASRPPIVTMGRDEAEARRLARLLQAVGIDDVRGVLADGIAGWRGAGLGVASTAIVEVGDLARALDRGEVALVDVRDPDEWDACHVGGALHLPFPTTTTAALEALDHARPVVVAIRP